MSAEGLLTEDSGAGSGSGLGSAAPAVTFLGGALRVRVLLLVGSFFLDGAARRRLGLASDAAVSSDLAFALLLAGARFVAAAFFTGAFFELGLASAAPSEELSVD